MLLKLAKRQNNSQNRQQSEERKIFTITKTWIMTWNIKSNDKATHQWILEQTANIKSSNAQIQRNISTDQTTYSK